MKTPRFDPIELLKRAAKLKGGISSRDYNKFQTLFAKAQDPRVYASLEASLAYHELRESLDNDPFSKPCQMKGDIVLGKNPTGISRYDSAYASSHLLGIGATGVGKTVFLVSLLLQYMFIADGIWIFDFIKEEFRGIKRLAEKIGKKVIVCRHEMLRINPLEPQEIEPSLYANTAAEFLTLSLNLPPVAKLILKICITNLYSRFGLFTSPNADPPTLFELMEEVRNFNGNKPARDAILIRLQALLVNQRQTFNIRRGMPVSKLAEYFIVWELDSLEVEYQNLNVAYLVSTLFAQRVKKRSNKLVAVALDEAARIYSKKAEAANNGPSYISTMTGVIRKMNIALFVMTQTCKDLSHSILANSAIKVLLRVGLDDDYDAFGRAMGLVPPQIQFCKTGLGIGTQVIKMGFGWLEPFLNSSPKISIPENVTDMEVHQSAQELMDLVPKPAIPRLLLPQSTLQATTTTQKEVLTCDENALLKQITANPDISSLTDHYQMAGLSTKRGGIAKQGLVQKNMIKETPVESGRRGRAQLFIETVSHNGSGRTGGALHNYIRDIAEYWHNHQGCLIEREAIIKVDGQNRYVDIVVTWPGGRKEAVEIETEYTERAIENIKKNLSVSFDHISVLTPNKKVREAIRTRAFSEINKNDFDKVKFPSLDRYDQH